MTARGGGHTCAKRHHKQTRDEGDGVKGLAGASRCAQRSP
jgi:hypothetical protein